MRTMLALISIAAAALAGGAGFAAPEVNVTRDLQHRYGEVQIAVNPKNNNNLVYADVKLAETTACAEAKNPDCDSVPTHSNGAGVNMSQPRGFFTRKGFSGVGVFYTMDRG